MKNTHITLPDKIDNIVREYSIKYNIKYSQAVARLIETGITNTELNKSVNVNNALMDKMYYKLKYTTSLLEQIYSDLDFNELTNTKTSIPLNKFKNKYNKDNYDN